MRNPKDKTTILIVEDSPTQATQLTFILEQHDYQVSTASNGKEALAAINRHKPTIVISDILMPEMDGYQLCQHIKTNRTLRDIPVILLTQLSDPHDIIRGLECGADKFLTKPYEEKSLLAQVEFLLTNRELYEIEKAGMKLEIFFAGQIHSISSNRLQILNLLLSTYETAVQKNLELIKTQEELRTLNAQLEERMRKMQRFTSVVHHEIRTPVNIIHGYADIALQEINPKERHNMLLHIQKSTLSLAAALDFATGSPLWIGNNEYKEPRLKLNTPINITAYKNHDSIPATLTSLSAHELSLIANIQNFRGSLPAIGQTFVPQFSLEELDTSNAIVEITATTEKDHWLQIDGEFQQLNPQTRVAIRRLALAQAKLETEKNPPLSPPPPL